MNKELKSLERVKSCLRTGIDECDEDLDIIETALKDYKKLEKELDIDLDTLVKALKNGFYTIREDLGLIIDARLVLNHTYPKFEFIKDDSMYFYNLKDYGKTWALTKEELL